MLPLFIWCFLIAQVHVTHRFMSETDHKPAVHIYNRATDAGMAAAHEIATLLREKPEAVIGLATGSTPVGMYAELVRLHREEGLDFSKATFFNLDEYVGLPPEHALSFHHYMRSNLFDHVNADPARIFIPNGEAYDVVAECARYEEILRLHGPIDLQILGIGANGHIGFNEPGADLEGATTCVALTEKTRQDNARFFERPEAVPTHALTMGVSTILRAKRILLLAFGAAKAEAVGRLYAGTISPECPATALRRHENVTLFLDQAAASSFKFQL